MRIPRIYLSLPMAVDCEIELDENAMRHTVKVLRLKPGHRLVLFNGNGGEYQAELIHVEKRRARARLVSFSDDSTESNLYSHLALGISKGERMDFAIQKAVELGINEITPLYTEHCVVQLSKQREEKRTTHWQSVIISACEQSGRNQLPILNLPAKLGDFISQEHTETCLMLDQKAQVSMQEAQINNAKVLLCVGPEGGFSQDEVVLGDKNGFTGVNLGPRTLRTETAAMISIAIAQSLWGDL